MKKIIIFSIAMLFSIMTFAQSPYQTKCFEIYKKYMRIMCAETKTTNKLEEWFNTLALTGAYPIDYEAARTEKTFAAMDLNYTLQFPSKVEDLRSKMKAEFEDAKALMNESDKIQYKMQTEVRLPLGKAKWEGASKFYAWTKKGEYETSSAWDERLKAQSHRVFDSIMIKTIRSAIKNNYWYIEYGNYDADNGSLELVFKDMSGKNWVDYQFPVSPQEAQNFKSNNRFYKDDIKYHSDGAAIKSSGKQELRMYYLYKDICYIDDMDASFIPHSFFLEYNSKVFEFDNTKRWNAVKDITYSFDDFGIDLDCLKGYVFSYKQAYYDLFTKEEERRKREQDSIAKAEEKRINDSIAQIERRVQEERDDIAYLENNKSNIAVINFLDTSKNTPQLENKRKELIEFAQTRKEKPYYLTIVDCFVRTNSIMSKEYKKNGWCFIDPDFSSEKFVEAANQGKIDFFDAYLSGNYNAVLQSKKKK